MGGSGARETQRGGEACCPWHSPSTRSFLKRVDISTLTPLHAFMSSNFRTSYSLPCLHVSISGRAQARACVCVSLQEEIGRQSSGLKGLGTSGPVNRANVFLRRWRSRSGAAAPWRMRALCYSIIITGGEIAMRYYYSGQHSG